MSGDQLARALRPCGGDDRNGPCPWRKDAPPGEFPACRFDALRSTVTQQFPQPIFACHKSREGRDIACAGYLAVEGHGSVTIRLEVATGRLDPAALQPGPDWPELYGSFDEMVAAQDRSADAPRTGHAVRDRLRHRE